MLRSRIPRLSRVHLFSRAFSPDTGSQPRVVALAVLVALVVLFGLALQYAAIA